MAFQKGNDFGKGRPKGSKNKNTEQQELIATIFNVFFNKLDREQYLYDVAIADPRTFISLLGKLLPKDINISSQNETVQKTLDDFYADVNNNKE